MIIVPTGTDAPIYHWPYATVAMILINIAVFFAIPPGSNDPVMDENDEVIEHVLTNFDRYSLALQLKPKDMATRRKYDRVVEVLTQSKTRGENSRRAPNLR